jgi:predicted Zn-ribbon and HTH transcriptional regulator
MPDTTSRRRIMAELEKGPLTIRDLSKTIRISEKEAIAHMEHVEKSLRPPMKLLLFPPVCHKCGFIFKGRHRFSTPGRCPECRHEGIQPPSFQIQNEAGGKDRD